MVESVSHHFLVNSKQFLCSLSPHTNPNRTYHVFADNLYTAPRRLSDRSRLRRFLIVGARRSDRDRGFGTRGSRGKLRNLPFIPSPIKTYDKPSVTILVSQILDPDHSCRAADNQESPESRSDRKVAGVAVYSWSCEHVIRSVDVATNWHRNALKFTRKLMRNGNPP